MKTITKVVSLFKEIITFLKRSLKFVFKRAWELAYKKCLQVKYWKLYRQITSDEDLYNDFRVNALFGFGSARKLGISGFYRVKDDAFLLEASVKSHIKYLDEIIIVYNDCTDNTAEVAHKLKEQFPDKIKVYHYKPKVYPALSLQHALLPTSSVHSLANYYNFALSKTTRKVAVKIDADHLAIEPKFANAVEHIKTNKPNTMVYFYGLNLFPCHNSEQVCVNKKSPFTAGLDCGFFPVNKNTYFIQRLDSEALRIPFKWYLTRFSLGVLFYHLKGFKPDRGLYFKSSTDSEFQFKRKKVADLMQNPALVPVDKFSSTRLSAKDLDLPKEIFSLLDKLK